MNLKIGIENIQCETHTHTQRLKNRSRALMLNNFKYPNICIIEVPEEGLGHKNLKR